MGLGGRPGFSAESMEAMERSLRREDPLELTEVSLPNPLEEEDVTKFQKRQNGYK